jgi:hypothetical protein
MTYWFPRFQEWLSLEGAVYRKQLLKLPKNFPPPPELLVRLEQVHHIHICPQCGKEFECGCSRGNVYRVCDVCEAVK